MIVAHIELADDHAKHGQAHKAIIHHQTETEIETEGGAEVENWRLASSEEWRVEMERLRDWRRQRS